jgi:hypothetical protein
VADRRRRRRRLGSAGGAVELRKNSDSGRFWGRARLQSCRKSLTMPRALATEVSFLRPGEFFSSRRGPLSAGTRCSVAARAQFPVCRMPDSTHKSESGGLQMKVFYVLTLVVGTICLCAVQGGKGTFPSSTGPHVTAKGYPLACNVSVKNSTWDKNSPVEVSIVIENRSSNTLNMRIVPSLSLTASDVAEEPQRSELSYVALMNLPGAGAGSVAMSRTVPLRLNGMRARR